MTNDEAELYLSLWDAVEMAIPAAKRHNAALAFVKRLRDNIEDFDMSAVEGHNDVLDEAIKDTEDYDPEEDGEGEE